MTLKGYLVLDLSIHALADFLEYAEKIPAYIRKHGGRYLVQGDVPENIEGDWAPERLVILEFPSPGHAREFLADPDAQDLFSLRHRSTRSQLILAEGCV